MAEAPAETQQRRERVAQLFLTRQPIATIARAVGTSRQTVYADLKFWKETWRRELHQDQEKHRARELAAIDHMEAVAAQREATAVTKGDDEGAARWWDRRLKAMERRAKLLGIDYREEAPGSTPEKPLYTYDVSAIPMTLEQAETIMAVHQQAMESGVQEAESIISGGK